MAPSSLSVPSKKSKRNSRNKPSDGGIKADSDSDVMKKQTSIASLMALTRHKAMLAAAVKGQTFTTRMRNY
jgi:hypothetical protein